MPLSIEQDHFRFREIVRGRVKQDLKKYISNGELIGKQGDDFVSIPVPRIDLPRFRFDSRQQGGVAQGEGEPGDVVSAGEGEEGSGEAGNTPGGHILEVDFTLEELAQMLAEELELPRIQPRGDSRLKSEHDRYSRISKVGPESLRHFKRTYREALKRQIATGSYNPADPRILPVRDDRRYLSWTTKQQPESNALILYMMDVSGSMGDIQKEIVRITSFWIDTWIQTHYAGSQTRYIVHDAMAHEVDREQFFHIRESGGTVISSAYELCRKIVEEEYPEDLWNVYIFHFSDGDNWSSGDTDKCVELLQSNLLPRVNLFGYGQVESAYGSGQFIHALERGLSECENLTLSRIAGKEEIYQSIKDFLGKGK